MYYMQTIVFFQHGVFENKFKHRDFLISYQNCDHTLGVDFMGLR